MPADMSLDFDVSLADNVVQFDGRKPSAYYKERPYIITSFCSDVFLKQFSWPDHTIRKSLI